MNKLTCTIIYTTHGSFPKISKKKAVLQQIVSDIKWFIYSWNHSRHHTDKRQSQSD